MKDHLQLLGQLLPDISPILALRSLFPWEGEYVQSDGQMRVEQRNATRHLCLGDSGSPALIATLVGDNMHFINGTERLTVPMQIVLRALGCAQSERDGATLIDLDSDALHDRVQNLDHAWVLMRAINGALPCPDLEKASDAVAKILLGAVAWQKLRQREFEANPPKTIEAQKRDFADQCTRQRFGVDLLKHVELACDPRGSAFAIYIPGRDFPFDVSACAFNWAVGQVALPQGTRATQPKKRKAGALPQVGLTKLKPETCDVLRRVVITGSMVIIPERLTPKVYQDVNEVLRTLGGEWHTGKQAHVFPEPPNARISGAIAEGGVRTFRDFEFFETQSREVQQVIAHAKIRPGMKVLEPQAGRAALALAAAAIVGKSNVTCHELMPENVAELQRLGFVIEGPRDFLCVPPDAKFDAVILNPPFSGGRDILHIEHALKFVKPGGTLTAIASTSWQQKETERCRAFRAMLGTYGAVIEDIPAGAFKAAGTGVPTVLIALTLPRGIKPKAATQPQFDLFAMEPA